MINKWGVKSFMKKYAKLLIGIDAIMLVLLTGFLLIKVFYKSQNIMVNSSSYIIFGAVLFIVVIGISLFLVQKESKKYY